MSTCRVCNRGWDDGTDPAVPCGALRRKQYCRVLIVPHGVSLPPPARADQAWLPRRGCRSCAQNRRAILRCRRAAVRYPSACSTRLRQCWRSLQNESGVLGVLYIGRCWRVSAVPVRLCAAPVVEVRNSRRVAVEREDVLLRARPTTVTVQCSAAVVELAVATAACRLQPVGY